MGYRFNIFHGNDRLFYWRFVAANGEIMCHSEGYTTKQSALHAVNVMRNQAGVANVTDLT
jgi:uncharacterized protein YegP (UPF0339 family)